ncbi:hypothetical protein niasHT_034610 [Heterodera trifolii]|uniref:MULE transposase domain-containing protein n=1 Tax=Heterodera trifolii TaxID=157864 RepID=A0ABD2ILL4_9BILA
MRRQKRKIYGNIDRVNPLNSRVISDFEIATIRAMRETFPAAQLTGCLFHMSQAVFRKWREMGLAELYASDEEQGEGARNSFRKLLAQALIPGQHVRRGFALIVNHTPDGLAAFFGYFARVYVGLIAHEQEAVAFAPGTDRADTVQSATMPLWMTNTVLTNRSFLAELTNRRILAELTNRRVDESLARQ